MPQRAQPLLIVAIGSQDAGHSIETASDELEEGGDDVKSVRPLCLGLHTCYNAVDNALLTREGMLIA